MAAWWERYAQVHFSRKSFARGVCTVHHCAVWASKRGLARKKAEEVGGAIYPAQKITSPSLLSKFAHHLLLLHKSGPDLERCSMSRLMGRGKAEFATSCPNICICLVFKFPHHLALLKNSSNLHLVQCLLQTGMKLIANCLNVWTRGA